MISSDSLARRKPSACGDRDDRLMGTFMVDLSDTEWLQFIKINFIDLLFGGAMQSL